MAQGQADEEDRLLFDQLLDVSACNEDDLLSVCGSSILDSESLLGTHEDLEPCTTPTVKTSLPPPTNKPSLPPPAIKPSLPPPAIKTSLPPPAIKTSLPPPAIKPSLPPPAIKPSLPPPTIKPSLPPPAIKPSLPPPAIKTSLPPPAIKPLQQWPLPQPSSRVDPDGAGESYEEGSGKDASVMGKVIQLNQRIGFRYVPEDLPLVEIPPLARGSGRAKEQRHGSKKSRPHQIVSEPSLLLDAGSPCKRQKTINDLRMMITANRQARSREQHGRAISLPEGPAESRVVRSNLTPSLGSRLGGYPLPPSTCETEAVNSRLGGCPLPPSTCETEAVNSRLGGCPLGPVAPTSLQNQGGPSVLPAGSPLVTSAELYPAKQISINMDLGAMDTPGSFGTSASPGVQGTGASPATLGVGTSSSSLGLSFHLLPSQSIFVCRPRLVNKKPGGFSLSHLRQSPPSFSLNHLRS